MTLPSALFVLALMIRGSFVHLTSAHIKPASAGKPAESPPEQRRGCKILSQTNSRLFPIHYNQSPASFGDCDRWVRLPSPPVTSWSRNAERHLTYRELATVDIWRANSLTSILHCRHSFTALSFFPVSEGERGR